MTPGRRVGRSRQSQKNRGGPAGSGGPVRQSTRFFPWDLSRPAASRDRLPPIRSHSGFAAQFGEGRGTAFYNVTFPTRGEKLLLPKRKEKNARGDVGFLRIQAARALGAARLLASSDLFGLCFDVVSRRIQVLVSGFVEAGPPAGFDGGAARADFSFLLRSGLVVESAGFPFVFVRNWLPTRAMGPGLATGR